MTEQSNAELIAELRGFAAGSESARASLMRDAADLLEAADQRAAEYAAVVEKVRAARANHPECELYGGDDAVSCGWKSAVIDIDTALATAPTDVLREHDAKLIEAYQSQIRSTIGAFGDADGVWAFDSAVKTVEEARQRREERV